MIPLTFALLFSLLPPTHGPLQDPPALRIHVRQVGSGLELTVYEAHSFENESLLLAWLRTRDLTREAPPRIVLQVDRETPTRAAFPLIEGLTRLGLRDLEIAVPKGHEEYIEKAGNDLEERQLVGFGGWLKDYYDEEFGPLARRYMWHDLDRALRENKIFLALNFLFSLPEEPLSSGEDSHYNTKPGEQPLSALAVRMLLEAIDGGTLSVHARKMLVDQLGTLGERRSARFLMRLAADEDAEFLLRAAAARSLHQLRHQEEAFLRGEAMGWLMPMEDTKDGRAWVRRDLETLSAWWKEQASEWSVQIEPRPEQERRIEENARQVIEGLEDVRKKVEEERRKGR